ncbi:MAG TPA: quinone oxidoreductase [Pyrinomonadaceae bacterium]|jgi:NADPH2:quinone reductase|nr:quinone oxidoreductase [Pyrinomonadaceae bacterium]
MKAIRVEEYGGADKLLYEDAEQPAPKSGEALVRVEAVGVNYIDIYHRTGLYQLPLPFTPGSEAAGTVEAVGADVNDIQAGDRVAYAMALGAYAEYACVPAARLVKIPDGIETQTAAAAMLQGMTAHYLVTSTYTLKPGETALVHAAAGGVGLLLIQMAKRIGARVFGTVSTAEKAALAREAGADEVFIYTEQDFQAETKRATGGTGVQVVYDSVGQTTFMKSLDSLAPRGMLALFGQSSGTVPPFDAGLLAQKGSLFLTRPSLAHYTRTREELLWRAGEVLSWIGAGELKLRIEKRFTLGEAAEAHRQLEGRATTGKVLLIP